MCITYCWLNTLRDASLIADTHDGTLSGHGIPFTKPLFKVIGLGLHGNNLTGEHDFWVERSAAKHTDQLDRGCNRRSMRSIIPLDATHLKIFTALVSTLTRDKRVEIVP